MAQAFEKIVHGGLRDSETDQLVEQPSGRTAGRQVGPRENDLGLVRDRLRFNLARQCRERPTAEGPPLDLQSGRIFAVLRCDARTRTFTLSSLTESRLLTMRLSCDKVARVDRIRYTPFARRNLDASTHENHRAV